MVCKSQEKSKLNVVERLRTLPLKSLLSFAMPLCVSVYMCLAGRRLTSWRSFVVSNCDFASFPLISWVRCGTLLYRFLIFAPLLTSYLTENTVLISFETLKQHSLKILTLTVISIHFLLPGIGSG